MERKKTGPPPRTVTEDESAWMIKPFPTALKDQLKDAAHDYRMSLREYVIMVLRERLAADQAKNPNENRAA